MHFIQLDNTHLHQLPGQKLHLCFCLLTLYLNQVASFHLFLHQEIQLEPQCALTEKKFKVQGHQATIKLEQLPAKTMPLQAILCYYSFVPTHRRLNIRRTISVLNMQTAVPQLQTTKTKTSKIFIQEIKDKNGCQRAPSALLSQTKTY